MLLASLTKICRRIILYERKALKEGKDLPTSTLTSKGQITIPKAVRDRLHLSQGDRVDFVIEEDGRVELRPLGRSVKELKGFLHRSESTPVDERQLEESMLRYLSEEDDRVRRGD